MSQNSSRMQSDDSDNQDYDLKFKIMILGESMVGKTSFITRYTLDKFGERYLCTIGIDFQVKIVSKNGKEIKLQIWDTAGQERYRNVAKSYFQSSQGFIVCYDISNKNSFNQVKYWVEQIKSISDEKTKCILVGTKCDLSEREVSEEEGSEFAKKLGFKFFETSAKLNMNVNEAFDGLLDEILLNYRGSKRNSMMLSKKLNKKEKKSCC